MSHTTTTTTHTHHRHIPTLSPYNMLIPHNTPTLTFTHSHNYSHNTISLALPSTLALMANLIPNTLIYSPHMTTPSPIATHYIVLQIHLGTIIQQQLHYVMASIPGCVHKSCPFSLHTKQTSAHHSVRAYQRGSVSVGVGGGHGGVVLVAQCWCRVCVR